MHVLSLLSISLAVALVSSQCGPGGKFPYPPGSSSCPQGPPPGGKGNRPPPGGKGNRPPPGGKGNRPPPGGRGGNGQGPQSQCSSTTQFTGSSQYMTGAKPMKAPLRGNIGCIDLSPLATRPTVTVGGGSQAATNIYGPMEAGFTNQQPGTSCLGSNSVPGGVDTHTADHVIGHVCKKNIEILDSCGGHAVPYHYHEKMSCLYTDTTSNSSGLAGHSTRIGTALDGNGIYGHHIAGGVVPTDLDACGGRTGVTPDSNGERVYYYVVQDNPPFTVGCFGKKDHFTTVEECRSLYTECSDGKTTTLTTDYGTDTYKLDCPCFDSNRNNLAGRNRVPNFLKHNVTAFVNGDASRKLRGARL